MSLWIAIKTNKEINTFNLMAKATQTSILSDAQKRNETEERDYKGRGRKDDFPANLLQISSQNHFELLRKYDAFGDVAICNLP